MVAKISEQSSIRHSSESFSEDNLSPTVPPSLTDDLSAANTMAAEFMDALADAPPPLAKKIIHRIYPPADYEVLRTLGEGQEGLVVEVQTPKGSTAALKICIPRIPKQAPIEQQAAILAYVNEAFERQAEILRHANKEHVPNIPEFQDFFQLIYKEIPSKGLRTDVLPFPDLHTIYIQGERTMELSAGWMLDRAKDGLTTLKRLHELGIAHLDLKPENLTLSNRGNLIIIDFGYARWIKDIDPSKPAGTMSYFAPEQLLRSPYGEGADIWGFASALFFLYTNLSLIPVALLKDRDQETADSLLLMEAIIGKNKQNPFFQKQWARQHLFHDGYFNSPRTLSEESNAYLQQYIKICKRYKNKKIPIWKGLVLYAAALKKDNPSHVETFMSLLERMLTYDVRITAAGALEKFFEASAESKGPR